MQDNPLADDVIILPAIGIDIEARRKEHFLPLAISPVAHIRLIMMDLEEVMEAFDLMVGFC